MKNLPPKKIKTLPTVAIDESTKDGIQDIADSEGRTVCNIHRKALVYIVELYKSGELEKCKVWGNLRHIK